MRERYKDLPLNYVGHSFGGQALGLLPNNSEVSRALLIAAQAGYWKLMASPERYRVYAMLNFVGTPAHPAAGLCAGLERIGRGFAQGRVRAMGQLGDEPALYVRRSQPPRTGELCEIPGRAARAVSFRRSLGDAARGRVVVFGIYLDQAGYPDGHARPMPARPASVISVSSAPSIATRCGGVPRNGFRPGIRFELVCAPSQQHQLSSLRTRSHARRGKHNSAFPRRDFARVLHFSFALIE